jgi:pimeloyl-ACP methyl ester carboxylesterase
MGGALASLFADKHRSRIGSLVLVAPAGLMDSGPITRFQARFRINMKFMVLLLQA